MTQPRPRTTRTTRQSPFMNEVRWQLFSQQEMPQRFRPRPGRFERLEQPATRTEQRRQRQHLPV